MDRNRQRHKGDVSVWCCVWYLEMLSAVIYGGEKDLAESPVQGVFLFRRTTLCLPPDAQLRLLHGTKLNKCQYKVGFKAHRHRHHHHHHHHPHRHRHRHRHRRRHRRHHHQQQQQQRRRRRRHHHYHHHHHHHCHRHRYRRRLHHYLHYHRHHHHHHHHRHNFSQFHSQS